MFLYLFLHLISQLCMYIDSFLCLYQLDCTSKYVKAKLAIRKLITEKLDLKFQKCMRSTVLIIQRY